MDFGDPTFLSPTQLEDLDGDFKNELDYFENEDLDLSNIDFGDELTGDLNAPASTAHLHEKRKSHGEMDGSGTSSAKRQETGEGEKVAKKPGRKPLTNEPTTKRKAQNRAAQRAFRERKEKHLKDLETKVDELTKSQDDDRRENDSLKSQIERLQTELRTYRKRLSVQGRVQPSPLSAYPSQDIQLDFATFGVPADQAHAGVDFFAANSHTQDASSSRPSISSSRDISSSNDVSSATRFRTSHTSSSSSIQDPVKHSSNPELPFATFSTVDNAHGFASMLPQMSNTSDPFSDLFTPSILKAATNDSGGNYFDAHPKDQVQATSGPSTVFDQDRVFQFNGRVTASNSASPSASSGSYWNTNNPSSTNTSPEPLHDSPAFGVNDCSTACEGLSPTNGVPQASAINADQTTTTEGSSLEKSLSAVDVLDPALFGGYRDANEDGLLGVPLDGSFDAASPSNLFGILNSDGLGDGLGAGLTPVTSHNLMAQVDKTCGGGDDDPLAVDEKISTGDAKYISCRNMWSQLQTCPDYQDGKLDMDGLCSELRSKARCSESGIVVDQHHFDAAFEKLRQDPPPTVAGSEADKPKSGPMLMFEVNSWDAALKKSGGRGFL